MNHYLMAIVFYAVLLILTGFIVTRYVKGAADFFVAGRQLGPGLLFTTLIAANIGAGSTVGVTGIAYQHGLSAWWWIGTSAVGSLVLAYFVGPQIWQVAQKYNLYTLGDYLDMRYSRYFRGLIALMMAVGTLALFAGQLIGIAWILGVVAGVGKTMGIIIGAMVTTLYFAAGGLLSAVIVNILEVAVIFAGFVIAAPYAMNFVGGFSGLEKLIAQNAGSAEAARYFRWDGIGLTTIIGYFLMLTPSFFISPGLIGKVYGAKDIEAVKSGTAWNAIVQFGFAFLPALLGMCAYAVFPNLSQRELALPVAMKELMPFWVSALALAAIFAAEVSTADAVLYMLATSFTKDLYKTFINPNIPDASLLKAGRIVSLVSGLLGVGMALLLPNIITALSIFYSLMAASLTAPLLFGLFSARPTTTAAFVSAIVGVATTVVLHFGNHGKGLWILNAQSTGILAAIVVMIVLMYVAPTKKPAPGRS
ncbi:sodium:solute symporter family protein [Sporolituus thermophilus]|uniref:Solute:Na+ symporter, SSS family n=1 Tax=Sporolituus thermophilus DSM 23256 TaxID=1123285 RepID=A0A1G7MAL4_9FIRM|nr:sodium:solute symporter family protein [Sporolituus thermophilus]SDF58765.1 solute:Na+ symporter, SSS family [Sporolituus thermophilus DSM 23256]